MLPVLNRQHCSAQAQICPVMPACPQHAVYYVLDEQEPLGGRIVIDYTRCDGCGQCVTACCGQAIEMRDEPVN